MIDTQTYRQRIGSFGNDHIGLSSINGETMKTTTLPTPQRTKSSRCEFNITALTLLVVIGLAATCLLQDPGVESNPGPSPTFESKEESTQYNLIRKQNIQIAKVSSHRFLSMHLKRNGNCSTRLQQHSTDSHITSER